MAVDYLPPIPRPEGSPGDGPGFVVPDFVPTELANEVMERDIERASEDHRVIAAAAAATASAMRPEGDTLRVIQEKVSAWIGEKYGDHPESVSAEDRIRSLISHLSREYIGSVALFDLDATDAFLIKINILDRAAGMGILGRESTVIERGSSLLEAAPALIYASDADRPKLVRGLPGFEAEEAVVKGSDGTSEKDETPTFDVRKARLEDIPAMVDIDMRSFNKVYQGYDVDEETMRRGLTEKFLNRYRLLGGKWMPVVTKPDETGVEKVVGFMVACPTSKTPNSFSSWEDTTDDGTLNSLYDPKGKNAYVVTLSMDPSVKGEHGQDQLFMYQLGSFIERDMNIAFFESRLPGLRTWVEKQCEVSGIEFDSLSEEEKLGLAEEYSSLKRSVNGKAVPYDPLLRLYSVDFGCNFVRVLPNAYKDEPSMDFGVLYTFGDKLPMPWLRKIPILRNIVAMGVRRLSRSTEITKKLVKAL